ncbi:hypothetical protein EPA93_15420 [Ktedonosporobacter rubrisoli]|uniref:Uncharacterized protein n=1 Tax=Ktedonosporobacter rubrisoli TaxID=2509675 RepID=A0A4P6JPT5_KTERU|nr:hypothetical protein [Ktedonosporobacter rubrisoli]QBD77305.1 hypothetical protein EPA93_15420 [Ktedonosporobacter rubrisoli]
MKFRFLTLSQHTPRLLALGLCAILLLTGLAVFAVTGPNPDGIRVNGIKVSNPDAVRINGIEASNPDGIRVNGIEASNPDGIRVNGIEVFTSGTAYPTSIEA